MTPVEVAAWDAAMDAAMEVAECEAVESNVAKDGSAAALLQALEHGRVESWAACIVYRPVSCHHLACHAPGSFGKNQLKHFDRER